MGAKVDLEIVRFAGTRDASVTELVHVLGMTRDEASLLVSSGGGTIKHGIPRAIAETYRDGLARAGIVVEIRDTHELHRSERPKPKPKSASLRPPERGITDVIGTAAMPVIAGASSSVRPPSAPPMSTQTSAEVHAPRAPRVPSIPLPRDARDDDERENDGGADLDVDFGVEPDAPTADAKLVELEPVPKVASVRPAPMPASMPPGSIPPPREPNSPNVPGAPPVGAFHVVSRGRAPAGEPQALGEREDHAEDVGFWAAIGPALTFPFRGPGIKWIAWIALYTVFLQIMSAVARWAGIFGMLAALIYAAGLIALLTGFYRACLWARSVGETSPNDMPEMDAGTLKNDFIAPGIWAGLFIVASQALVVGWIIFSVRQGSTIPAAVTSPITWALAAMPVVYWPMGIGRIALTGNFGAIWDFPSGLRVIFKAPLEYLVVVVIAIATYVVPVALFVLVLASLGSVAMLVSAPFLVGIPLAYSHGVQGTLMAHLFRKAAPALEE